MSNAPEQTAPIVWRPPPAESTTDLRITRGNYIALHAPDPSAAAKFAVDHMGFALVHIDGDGRHYLAAHGVDPYSLVYAPGEGELDHLSFLVEDGAALARAAEMLTNSGVSASDVEPSDLWRHQPALRFKTPSGTVIELTTGIDLPAPMSEVVAAPSAVPAPMVFDHAILRQTDLNGAIKFATQTLGLKESGRILAPDGIPILAFFRGRILFHCFGIARSARNGLHHYQFTLKNDRALMAAHDKMAADPGVEIVWGPVRHGCGSNLAFYFLDQVGNVVEYSAEEELILSDEVYEVLHWTVTNQRATDEWGSHPPESITQ